ncbi:MFS transporter [soil metagenome]
MNAYVSLLRTPGVARIIAAQLTARFPSGMLSLGFLLHMQHIFGSYGAAGLVLAATSVGQAVSGPLTSRWMGVWGMRPVLALTTSICAVSLLTVALVPLPLVGYMVVGLITGLSYPPVQPAVRTIYPKMVNSRQLTPLFSLDASAQEIIWIAGPVVVTLIATQISTTVGILVSVVFLLGGGLWFLLSPELGRVRIPRSKRKLGAVLKRPQVLLSTVVGFLLVGACAATEAGVVATFGQGNSTSGLVLAIWAVASLLGGLFLGHIPVGPWALARRMVVVLVGSILATAAILIWTGTPAEFWTLSGALLVAGLCIAPALAVMFAVVSSSVRFSDTAEAYGWVGTGQLIGAAAGSAVAGFLIDYVAGSHGGGAGLGGFIVAVIFAAVGTLVPVLFHRALPDLRGRDASPLPDTEPVSVQPS